MGQAEGFQGQSFAIPTMNVNMGDIEVDVMHFIENARQYPEKTFLVTKIGCGVSGLKIEQIAPFFYEAAACKNIRLSQAFINYLNGDEIFAC